MRTWDHYCAHWFFDSILLGSFNGLRNCGYITTNYDRDKSSTKFFLPCNELHISSLAHDIHGYHCCRNAWDFKESIRFSHETAPFLAV